jgi:hypothetical protein
VKQTVEGSSHFNFESTERLRSVQPRGWPLIFLDLKLLKVQKDCGFEASQSIEKLSPSFGLLRWLEAITAREETKELF